jgi:hypothetical protein
MRRLLYLGIIVVVILAGAYQGFGPGFQWLLEGSAGAPPWP